MLDLLKDGISISVVGMSVVFSILVLISIFIYFLRFLAVNEKTEMLKEDEIDLKSNGDSEEEIVAVISAAITSYFGRSDFVLNNITEVTDEKPLNEDFKEFNIWSKYGRMNIMTSHSNFGKGRLEKWRK